MKKILTMALSFLLACSAYAQPLYVGTYNIRYNNPNDVKEGNGWQQRCPHICDFLNFENPDIFGTQEVLVEQLRDLKKGLPHYEILGVGRDDGKEAGEYAAIFYNTERLKPLESGHFWLSETPEKPSLGWDAACVRICTWGKFLDKITGKKFYFFNTHMDHVGVVARREGARLILNRIQQMAQGKRVILTGDFNVDQTNELYKLFNASGVLRDCYANAEQRMAPIGTWNDYMQDYRDNKRIDHIFVSAEFDVKHYGIFTNSYWLGKTRRNPSDHYPVMVKLQMTK